MTGVREVFTIAWLLDVADEGSLDRGVAYEQQGRVSVFRDDPNRVEATVQGAEPNLVELIIDAGRLGWFCSCPAAAEGSPCRHAVATGLALVGMQDTRPATPTPAADALGNRREATAARDVRAWRKRVTSTFAAGGRFVDHRRAPEWAAGVHDPLDEVEELLAAGHAEAVVKLAEDAHRRAETALNRIDDSAGWLTDISHRLARIYQAAVARACPDPRSLADRLFKLEVDSHTLDTFHRAAATYADALRAEGITRYRELVEAAWAEADHSGPRWENFRLQQARIAVASAAGDADELIAVMGDELHSPYDHHEIAQTLADTGRTEEAIDWARRGLEQYADRWHQTPKLRDWLAALLDSQDRPGEVAALYWDAFVRGPTLGTYRQLVDHATDRDTASVTGIAHLKDRVGTPVGTTGHTYPVDSLIEILDHEGRHDEAWTLYLEHGCEHDLAMRLTKRRETDHPLDAITVYDHDAEWHIARKNKTGYRAAVRQLTRLGELAAQAGSPDKATLVVERARAQHRQKRNLMTLLDEAGLGLT